MRWWKATLATPKRKYKRLSILLHFITALVTLVDQSECGCILVCGA
jgi:hypothetical protein